VRGTDGLTGKCLDSASASGRGTDATTADTATGAVVRKGHQPSDSGNSVLSSTASTLAATAPGMLGVVFYSANRTAPASLHLGNAVAGAAAGGANKANVANAADTNTYANANANAADVAVPAPALPLWNFTLTVEQPCICIVERSGGGGGASQHMATDDATSTSTSTFVLTLTDPTQVLDNLTLSITNAGLSKCAVRGEATERAHAHARPWHSHSHNRTRNRTRTSTSTRSTPSPSSPLFSTTTTTAGSGSKWLETLAAPGGTLAITVPMPQSAEFRGSSVVVECF
jgi:hypothetical protein